MYLQENTFLTFDLDRTVKVTRNIVQYPLHHVTYAPVKFEVNTSNGLGGNTFTRKYIICSIPSSLCDPSKVCSCFNQWFGRSCIYKKRDGQTDAHMHRWMMDLLIQNKYTFFLKKKADIINRYDSEILVSTDKTRLRTGHFCIQRLLNPFCCNQSFYFMC